MWKQIIPEGWWAACWKLRRVLACGALVLSWSAIIVGNEKRNESDCSKCCNAFLQCCKLFASAALHFQSCCSRSMARLSTSLEGSFNGIVEPRLEVQQSSQELKHSCGSSHQSAACTCFAAAAGSKVEFSGSASSFDVGSSTSGALHTMYGKAC